LAEVDGSELGGTVAGNRLKLFHPRPDGFSMTAPEDETAKRDTLEVSDEAETMSNAQGTSISGGPGGGEPAQRPRGRLRGRLRLNVLV